MDSLFFKSVYCLSGLGIVRKNRRILKHSYSKKYFFKVELIVFILISVLSLRSFCHEFTRFGKNIIHGAIEQIKHLDPKAKLKQTRGSI